VSVAKQSSIVKVCDDRKIYDIFSMYLGLFYVIFSSFNKLQDQKHEKSSRKPKWLKLHTSWIEVEEKNTKKAKNEDFQQKPSYHDGMHRTTMQWD
jgi:hypothetical protein